MGRLASPARPRRATLRCGGHNATRTCKSHASKGTHVAGKHRSRGKLASVCQTRAPPRTSKKVVRLAPTTSRVVRKNSFLITFAGCNRQRRACEQPKRGRVRGFRDSRGVVRPISLTKWNCSCHSSRAAEFACTPCVRSVPRAHQIEHGAPRGAIGLMRRSSYVMLL